MVGEEIWKNIVKWRDQFVINLTMVYGSPRPGADHKKKLIYPYIFYIFNSLIFILYH